MNRSDMARYKLILAYDGTHFRGFQRQKTGRTVQGELEKALRTLGWEGTSILSAGRTDTGVHASGQVATVDLDWVHGCDALHRALNDELPDDLAVVAVESVSDDFHPRFDAVERSYRYRIYVSRHRDPLRERYAWRVWPPVNVPAMERAAELVRGSHDFSAFGTSPISGGTTLRTVSLAKWTQKGDELVFEVTANAFLYHMVRRLVFTMVLVGQNRLSLEDFRAAIQEAQPLPPGLAPPQGLVLLEVRYAEEKQEAGS